jgi:hypothetical protein
VAHIPATAKRARFVGIDAYAAAGGHIIRSGICSTRRMRAI